MSDLVARLRLEACEFNSADNCCNEAADRIESLTAELERLRALLRRVRGAVDGLELGEFIKLMDDIDAALGIKSADQTDDKSEGTGSAH